MTETGGPRTREGYVQLAGAKADGRYLIVNADDFGQSPGINRGIVQAYERGIVTSASLMVRWPAAVEAARYGRDHPQLSLGLHVDLEECAWRAGRWVKLYSVVPTGDAARVAEEVAAQVRRFRTLVGRDPSHVDSHQHVHLKEPTRTLVLEAAHQLGVPVRHFTRGLRYNDEFYGQSEDGRPLPGNITVERLAGLLRALPPGVTELGCHPGFADDLDTMYRVERSREADVLCDSTLAATLRDCRIELGSFHEVRLDGR